jgi:hypothetical protein
MSDPADPRKLDAGLRGSLREEVRYQGFGRRKPDGCDFGATAWVFDEMVQVIRLCEGEWDETC